MSRRDLWRGGQDRTERSRDGVRDSVTSHITNRYDTSIPGTGIQIGGENRHTDELIQKITATMTLVETMVEVAVDSRNKHAREFRQKKETFFSRFNQEKKNGNISKEVVSEMLNLLERISQEIFSTPK